MTRRPFRVFVLIMTGIATVMLLGLDWGALVSLGPRQWVGLLSLIFLGLLSESLALTIIVGKNKGSSSITFIPLFACVLIFGPTAAVLSGFISSGFTEFLVRRKERYRAFFNLSQFVISTALAGVVFSTVGGIASGHVFSLHILPFVAFGAVLLSVNHVAVSMGIALNEGLRFRPVLARLAGPWGTNLFYDLLVSPIAILVAFLYAELYVGGLVLVLFPLFFVRHSYFNTLRLQEANRDLLKALVKAIETRDPYTSGHSLRVSSLARRVAEMLHLPANKVERIETAALLHDIGKIEAVYAEILLKEHSLSNEERKIIESHVTKGVALLESLYSFPAEITLAVRHHHELFDGKGYPDQLSGDDIPLGGRIIKICDAIDAMMSDRPYRKALSREQIHEQLALYSGKHFDPHIVSQITLTTLLEDHWALLQEDHEDDALLDPGEVLSISVGPPLARQLS